MLINIECDILIDINKFNIFNINIKKFFIIVSFIIILILIKILNIIVLIIDL